MRVEDLHIICSSKLSCVTVKEAQSERNGTESNDEKKHTLELIAEVLSDCVFV